VIRSSRISTEVVEIQGAFTIMPATTKEEAFAELVREYENLWVAIIEKDGVEYVVGQGVTAVQAANDATEKGHPQAMLFKVPSFKSRFVY
jgi:hypothetical protein